MTPANLPALVRLTLLAPRDAARQILGLHLSRDALWTALALVAALNTFVLLLLIRVAPPDITLPTLFERPLALFVLLAGLLVLFIHAVFWAARMVGGKGDLGGLLAALIWLQALRAAAQLGIIVLVLTVPPLAALLSLVSFGWGLWILLSFVSQAMALPGLLHAVAALVVGVVSLAVGVGVLLMLIGLATQGVFAHV